MSTNKKIGFIGGGNMARSLIGGLVNQGVESKNLAVFDPDSEKVSELTRTFAISVYQSNEDLMAACDVVVLAIKPQIMAKVLRPLASNLPDTPPLIISVAAGIRTDSMEKWLQRELPLVRAMPNTPALVSSGATGLYANPHVSHEQKQLAETLLQAVGIVGWVEHETQLDVITALSGSGPAYFMLFMEILEKSAIELGLDADLAQRFVIQTCCGAGKLAADSDESLEQLKINVTSPGGTTERALQSMANNEIDKTLRQAVQAAANRADELAQELAED